MAQALDIADPQRRGACPTLHAPMQTGDGLLARIRVRGNRLSPPQLATVARLAETHGNGLVEITARGNLQVRGLTEGSSWPFAEAVSAALPIDTGLVVDTSPLAGDDPLELADPRRLAQAISTGARPFEDRLGPKVSIVVDGAGQISLASLKADIRLLATAVDRWAVSIGGQNQVATAGEAIALALGALAKLAALGTSARATDLVSSPMQPLPPGGGGWEGGIHTFQTLSGTTTPIGLPFGAASAGALLALAQAATAAGVQNLSLAPGHRLLVDNASPALLARAAALGLITTATDPRLRVSACIGSAGCRSGHIAARDLAARLAPHVPLRQHLHVSGCPKGCAHPRPSDLTLVGRADGIGLVISGRAGDTPSRMIDEPGLPAAVRTGR